MTDIFSVALFNFIANLGAGWLFVIMLSIMFLYTIFEVIFVICSFKKQKISLVHFILLCSLVVVEACLNGLCFLENVVILYPVLLLAFGTIFFIPVLVIEKKKKEIKEEHKKFINFIDDKIAKMKSETKNQEVINYDKIDRPLNKPYHYEDKTPISCLEKTETKASACINFFHVKNIISKLDNINLSNADLRQVKDLKTNVYLAESGGISQELKDKINDGLGALLKIMAKYGV